MRGGPGPSHASTTGWKSVSGTSIRPPSERRLANEAKLRNPSGGRVNDFPLSVTRDGTLRLQLNWPKAAAHLLRHDYTVRRPEESSSSGFQNMSRAEQEDHVLALAAAGDTFAAIKAARAVYGLDLTDAKAFVEELQGRADTVGPGPTTPLRRTHNVNKN